MKSFEKMEALDIWVPALKRLGKNHLADIKAEGIILKNDKMLMEAFLRAVAELSEHDSKFKKWATVSNIKILSFTLGI